MTARRAVRGAAPVKPQMDGEVEVNRRSRPAHVIAIAIFLAFAVLYAVSIGVDKRNLEWFNFVFDADPGRVLDDALNGQNTAVFMRHPLFALTIGALARMFSVVVDARNSVLYAVSVLSAGGVAAAFIFFHRVCARLVPAILFAVLYGLAAATWLLASIPETFAISSTLIVVMFLLHRPEFAQPRAQPIRFAANALVAALAVGVAVPNLVYAGLAFASNVRMAQRTVRRRLAVLGAYALTAFVLFAALGIVQRLVAPDKVGNRRMYGAPIVAAINDPFLQLDQPFQPAAMGRLVRAFAFDNVLAARSVVEAIHGPDGSQAMIQYGGRTSPIYLGAALALLVLVGVVGARTRWRDVLRLHTAQLAIVVIVYNVVFHYFYRANGQPLIFSTHSVFAVLVLVAHAWGSAMFRWREPALATAVTLTAANNATFLAFVNRALDQPCDERAGNVCLAWRPPVDAQRFNGGVRDFAQSADYPFELGKAEFNQGRFDASIPYFRRALSVDPRHVSTQLYLGSALIRANRLEEARAYLEGALARDQMNADLGQLLEEARRRADATP